MSSAPILQNVVQGSFAAGPCVVDAETQQGAPLLEIDQTRFKSEFNRYSFLVRHRLARHQLFSIPALIELSQRLPEESIKYNSGGIPVGTGLYEAPQTGLGKEETLRQIGDCNSWMVLKNVEQVPEYADLLNRCLDAAEPLCAAAGYGMFKREAFIFVSSPNSVTPFHIDPEHNFLLQIDGGRKTIRILDRSEHTLLEEPELEDFFTNSHYSPIFKDEYKQTASTFNLYPGDGLHFPVTTPHWVENGDEVSVSFSITFRSAQAERRGLVYEVNHALRRVGIKPSPFGAAPVRDSAKYFAYRALRRTRNLVGRFHNERRTNDY
jgi:hypothetical protein